MKNIPTLRFPEFHEDGEWEEKKLGDLLDYEQPTNYLVNDTNYNDSFKTPVLTAGKTFILGYTNETSGIFDNPLPVIIFDDFTTATQFVDFPFKAKSSAMKILKAKSDDFNVKVIFELMQNINYQAEEHKRYWISEYQNIEIKIPKPKEQQKIADCLSSVDGLISAQSQKIELLKEHKKGLMQQLFPSNHPALSGTPPKEGNVPKLRFPEFVNDWAFEELGKLGKFLGGGTPSKLIDEYWHGTIPWISSSDINEDDLKTIAITRFINEKSILESATKIIPKGSILFVSRVGTGKLAINSVDLCTSQDFTNFTPTQVSNYFLGYYFLANKSTLTSLDQGTSIKGFSKNDLEKFKLFYPKQKEEQQKIADCLSSVDEQINQQTNKLQTLKEHKKALMQQLFPSNHPALSGTPPTEGNSKDENVGDNSQNSPSLKGWQTKSDGVVKSKTTQEDKHA